MRRRISSLRYPTRTLRRLIMQCQCHHSSTLLLSSGAAALGSPFNISQEDSCFGRWLACDSARLCCGSGCASIVSAACTFTYQHRLLNYYTLNHLWHPQKRCDFGAAHYRFVHMQISFAKLFHYITLAFGAEWNWHPLGSAALGRIIIASGLFLVWGRKRWEYDTACIGFFHNCWLNFFVVSFCLQSYVQLKSVCLVAGIKR